MAPRNGTNLTPARAPKIPTALSPKWWWGFVLYGVLVALHVSTLFVDTTSWGQPTKLVLMPALILAVLWGAYGLGQRSVVVLLCIALGFSWVGDGAEVFFPGQAELPIMLAAFGVTHLIYIWLFWRMLAIRPIPRSAYLFGLWWLVLIALLFPGLGTMVFPVAIYGLILGFMAMSAMRANPLIAWGAVFFLFSDTVLAIRLFAPAYEPSMSSQIIMYTYCLGQGLIAAGAVVTLGHNKAAADAKAALSGPLSGSL